MRTIEVVGQVAPGTLVKLKKSVASVTDKTGIYFVFVMRQEHNFKVGGRFTINPANAGNGLETALELVAVTQQYDFPIDEIPRGWNTICAFRTLGGAPSVLATLPFIDEWYENYRNRITVVLTCVS
jgi:hypothetical protein